MMQSTPFYLFTAMGHHTEAALDGCGNLHIVVSVNTEDVFDNVAGTLYVHPVCGNGKFYAFLGFRIDAHFQAADNALHRFSGNLLADKAVNVIVFEASDLKVL